MTQRPDHDPLSNALGDLGRQFTQAVAHVVSTVGDVVDAAATEFHRDVTRSKGPDAPRSGESHGTAAPASAATEAVAVQALEVLVEHGRQGLQSLVLRLAAPAHAVSTALEFLMARGSVRRRAEGVEVTYEVRPATTL
jgi:hypothetical protein